MVTNAKSRGDDKRRNKNKTAQQTETNEKSNNLFLILAVFRRLGSASCSDSIRLLANLHRTKQVDTKRQL
jgi:hypothetical protein